MGKTDCYHHHTYISRLDLRDRSDIQAGSRGLPLLLPFDLPHHLHDHHGLCSHRYRKEGNGERLWQIL